MRSYDAAASTSASRDFASSHELVLNQCALLGKQLGQVGDLKRDAVSALHDLSGLAHNIDLALRPEGSDGGAEQGLGEYRKGEVTPAYAVGREPSRSFDSFLFARLC